MATTTEVAPTTAANLYLDLMKGCLTRTIFFNGHEFFQPKGKLGYVLSLPLVQRFLHRRNIVIMRDKKVDPETRRDGRDWPADAETMIGIHRLNNLQDCIEDILEQNVQGDFMETGVWRGGASIFMRAVLKAYGDTSRLVWLVDSFQGLPKPDVEKYPADTDDTHWQYDELPVSLAEVKERFRRYDLLDDQVMFLEGWFCDTLAKAPVQQLALLRLDGDLYESTMIALETLYPKVSLGGYIIVDDYGAVPGCKQATDVFRKANGITDPLQDIDWTGVFWKRTV